MVTIRGLSLMGKFDYDFGDKWNMSLMTLQRIDILLKHCQDYSVNNNLFGLRQNLLEIYKESNPWLNKKEKKKCASLWDKVSIKKIQFIEDDDKIIYPDGLREALDVFDFWIRNKLHKKKVTFDSRDNSFNRGLDGLNKKYNLKEDAE